MPVLRDGRLSFGVDAAFRRRAASGRTVGDVSAGPSLPVLPVVDVAAGPPPDARALLVRRARLLAWVGLAWHLAEAAVAVAAGVAAGSVALVGFGADSLIEAAAGLVVLWLMTGTRSSSPAPSAARSSSIAASFVVLAAYVGVEAIRDLVAGHRPGASWVGVVLAAVTLATMPPLAVAKRRVGERLGSAATASESRQTMLCAYLSAGAARRAAGERRPRLVVGRPGRRARHRRDRRPRGARRLARRRLRVLRGALGLALLQHGEDVAGGIGEPGDVRAALRASRPSRPARIPS